MCNFTQDGLETRHLSDCPPRFAHLADVQLVAGGMRFPAHSQYLAAQSQLIQQMLLDTGPISWQSPMVIEAPLQLHSKETLCAFLMAAYRQGVASIESVKAAWQLHQLADQLGCPAVLLQCKQYINTNILDFLKQSPQAAPEWLQVAHELQLEGLKLHCADIIARKWLLLAESDSVMQLPAEFLRYIMTHMAAKIKGALTMRSGQFLTKESEEVTDMTTTFLFFCDDIDCKGHTLVSTITAGNPKQHFHGASADCCGGYHCHKPEFKYTKVDGQLTDIEYPESVKEMFAAKTWQD